MASGAVREAIPKISRRVHNWHGVVANPTFAAHHQLSLKAFQHSYRWFPMVNSNWRVGTFELDPEKLRAGAVKAAEERVYKRAKKKGLIVKAAPRGTGKKKVQQKRTSALGTPDIRTNWYIQPSVKELYHAKDNVVPNVATKVTNHAALLEMHPPTKPVGAPGDFQRCYHAAMRYYKEILTKMFDRPVTIVSSHSTDTAGGNWDASFVAHYIRHAVEDNRAIAQCMKDIERNLSRSDSVRPVRHFDETKHYTVRCWRVYLKGRFHTSPFGQKERSRSIIHGQMPYFQLNKYIDYYQTTAQTTQGVLGIKVWIWLDNPK